MWNSHTYTHGLRTPREKIAFTAQPKIRSHSQIFRYGRSIFCLPHRPNFSDIFDLCLHWVSVVRDVTHGPLHVRTDGRSVYDWDLEYNETDFNSLSDFIWNFENYNNNRSLNLDLISTQIWKKYLMSRSREVHASSNSLENFETKALSTYTDEMKLEQK